MPPRARPSVAAPKASAAASSNAHWFSDAGAGAQAQIHDTLAVGIAKTCTKVTATGAHVRDAMDLKRMMILVVIAAPGQGTAQVTLAGKTFVLKPSDHLVQVAADKAALAWWIGEGADAGKIYIRVRSAALQGLRDATGVWAQPFSIEP